MGNVIISEYTTKHPITMIGEMAGICYNADTTDRSKNYARGLDCLISRHGRTYEFPDVYMTIDGYSARVMREWYTHIGGMPTRLQASTRYIDYEHGFEYYTPASISKNDAASQIYNNMMSNITEGLNMLDSLGISREDCANGLPLGMTTKVACKHNLRNLMDMSRQRMCARAYHEYRTLFNDVITALSKYSDEWKCIIDRFFMPKCEELGYCPEKSSCGRMKKKTISDPKIFPKVICISGKAGSGKDTTGTYLSEALEKSGKRVLITHYADLVKYVCIKYFGWDGIKDREGRSLLQRVGTDLVRNHSENFWVDFIAMMLDISASEWDCVIIPDCRFPNEINRLEEYGYDVCHVRIERPELNNFLTEEQKAHSSETALDHTEPDYTIINDGNLEELKAKISAFIKE